MFSLTRKTDTTLAVLRVFDQAPHDAHYGYDLMKQAGIQSGSLYPLLARLERLGIVSSDWEPVEPATVGRSPRRFYRLTDAGRTYVQELKLSQTLVPGGLARA